MLLRKGGGYRGAGLIASGFVISYGILTGSSGSAQRAVIMILCLWLGAERGRSYDSLSALGLSALILLGKNPYLLYHSGFQLSFGAVWAISGLGGWMRGRFKIRSWWQSGLLVSLCVQIVLTPVILYHYFQYPLYGMFLNLLIGPLVSIMMYSGILGICLGKFSLSAGILSVGAGHYILELYEWLCRMAEHLPGSCLVLGRPSVFSILLYVGVMTAVVWAAAEGAAIKEKGGKREEKEGAEKPGLAVSVLIVFYFLSLLIFIQHRGPGLEAVCLDVGQGDGLVLMEGKHTVLIDGGSSSQKKVGEKVLEPYLKSRGITHIDYGIVSHGDSDHINGLIYLLESSEDIDIDTLILPAMGRGEEVYRHMENLAAEKGDEGDLFKDGRPHRGREAFLYMPVCRGGKQGSNGAEWTFVGFMRQLQGISYAVYRRYGGGAGEEAVGDGRKRRNRCKRAFKAHPSFEGGTSWIFQFFQPGIFRVFGSESSPSLLWTG